MNEVDITSLAARAKRLGIDTRERVIKHLTSLIVRNEQYLAYRKSQNRHNSYNKTVERDNAVLAMTIVLLESLGES